VDKVQLDNLEVQARQVLKVLRAQLDPQARAEALVALDRQVCKVLRARPAPQELQGRLEAWEHQAPRVQLDRLERLVARGLQDPQDLLDLLVSVRLAARAQQDR
jgi:hypothetical protein